MTDGRVPTRLYLISPPRFAPVPFAADVAAALEAGDVACFQLRMKPEAGRVLGDGEILAAAEALCPLVQSFGVAFLVNDRPDLAAQVGADGAHVGQADVSYAQARAALGPDRIVGVTCHDSRHLAMEAAEAGADYVAFGAFYPTRTKAATHTAQPEILTWWQALMEVPCVAIGGITVATAQPLAQAGADFLAVSSGVWDFADGPAAAVRAFGAALRD